MDNTEGRSSQRAGGEVPVGSSESGVGAAGTASDKGGKTVQPKSELTGNLGLGAAAATAVSGVSIAPFVVDTPGAPLVGRQTAKGAPCPVVVRRRARLLSLAVAMADLAAVVAGYALSSGYQMDPRRESFIPLDSVVYLTVPLWLLVLASFGLYGRRQAVPAVEESRRVFQASTTSAAMVMLVTFFLDVRVSRGWILAVWASCTALLTVERLTFRRFTNLLRRNNVLAVRTLLVGVNGEARAIARTLGRQSWLGYRVVGFVDVAVPRFEQVDGRPVVGSVHDLQAAVARADAGVVIVAGTALTPDLLQQIDRELQPLGVDVRFSPGLPHVAASRIAIEPIDGMALLSLKRNTVTWRQALVKRSFDLAVSGALLVATAPILVLTALAVKLTSRGPVFFSQVRAGKGGVPFVIHKFRTMVGDAELRLDELASANEADGVLFKLRDDPRVTGCGRFLRSWGLDELPQLLNVLKGDMSLVGPRPALPREAELYDDEVRNRLRVKPGITGLWQVNGRHSIPYEDYVRYDRFYVENWSLGLDLYVVAKTLPALLLRRGSY